MPSAPFEGFHPLAAPQAAMARPARWYGEDVFLLDVVHRVLHVAAMHTCAQQQRELERLLTRFPAWPTPFSARVNPPPWLETGEAHRLHTAWRALETRLVLEDLAARRRRQGGGGLSM